MRFNNFFMEYKLRLKEIRWNIPWSRLPFYRKVSLIAFIVVASVYMIFVLPKEQVDSMFFCVVSVIFILIFIIIIGIFSLIDSKKRNRRKMLEEHYKPYSRARINMLVELLKNYGIKLNRADGFDKIDLLIEQAEENKIKDNPLLEVSKPLKLFGTIVIPAILFVATKIAEGLTIENLVALAILYVVMLAMIFAIIFSLKSLITVIIYPDYYKYEELIYDLKQLKIFYNNNND